jgi:predicted GIY-YIG superfamily endonuclease
VSRATSRAAHGSTGTAQDRTSAAATVVRLVYAEQTASIVDAIVREKAMKKWRRDWKIQLIEQANPEWDDLFERING